VNSQGRLFDHRKWDFSGVFRRIAALERSRERSLVAATLEPGASVLAVARAARIHPSQLYGWRRQLWSRPNAVAAFAAVRVVAVPIMLRRRSARPRARSALGNDLHHPVEPSGSPEDPGLGWTGLVLLWKRLE